MSTRPSRALVERLAGTTGHTAVGRSVLTAADAAAIRTLLALVPGTDVLAPGGNGSALTGITAAQVGAAATSHTQAASTISDSTAVGRSVLTATDAAAIRTLLSLVPGTDVLALNGNGSALTGITAAQVGAAATSHTQAASTISDSTAVGRSVLTAADAAAIRTVLSLVPGTDVLAPGGDGSALTGITAAQVGAAATSHTQAASTISDSTAVGRSVLTAADAAAARTALSLDSMATQPASSINVTGGSVSGLTVFAIDSTAQPASRQSLGVQPHLWPWMKDGTIGHGPAGGGAATYAQSNGVLLAYQQRLPTTNLNSSILIVTSAGAAGSVFRTGLLTPASDNRPGVLVQDNGTVAADSTGAKTITFGSALAVTNRTYYGLCLKDGASGTATISAGTFLHSEGDLGAWYVSGTPQVHPITWWYLLSQSGALSSDYSLSAWLPQVSTAIPRILYFP